MAISWGLRRCQHAGMVRALARARDELTQLAGRPVEAAEFSAGAGAALGRAMAFDGWCLFGLDPRTGLRTVQFGGRGTEHTVEMARNEALMADVNKYDDLALASRPAGWLSRDHPQARTSFRLHEILLPQGFSSEARLVLRHQGRMWGALVLFREDPRRPFDEDDATDLCELAGPLTCAVRAYPVRPLPRAGRQHRAGFVAIAADDRLLAVSPEAQAWLDDLVPGGDDETHAGDVTRVLFDAAHAVRRGDTARATTCVRTVSGSWLRVEGTPATLGEADVVVLLLPAPVGPLLDAFRTYHGLTRREHEVLGLVAQGMASKQAARELAISLQTVNGHLQALYRKCGVTGREELFGRLVQG
jgi:DNA-binding CsgD family transcriptional regulator